MEKSGRIIRSVLAAIVVVLLFAGFFTSGSRQAVRSLFTYLFRDAGSDSAVTVREIDRNFIYSMAAQHSLIDLNGSIAKQLDIRDFYSNSSGIFVTDDNSRYYVACRYNKTTTDFEVEQMIALRDFLDEHGVHLLYVNEPTKYLDDSLFRDSFGIESYSNRNMDLFLSRIRKAGINAIDLRDNIREENLDIHDLFYRTDHHWTMPAGMWAAGIIADGLNRYCGYDIDLSVFNPDNFDARSWSSCWLGEQGRKLGATYVGLDDYTELKPKFPTDYTFTKGDGTVFEGTFDDFIDETYYDTEKSVYDNESWHYSTYIHDYVNHNVGHGKLLILGDSYEYAMHCFLSLGVHEADILIRRNYSEDFSLRDHILENGYDTVLIAYAQHMVGAHDTPGPSNYKMFIFDK